MVIRIARRRRLGAGVTALGVAAALAAAPAAVASPEDPAEPPAPAVLIADAAAGTQPGAEAEKTADPVLTDPLLTDGADLVAAADSLTPPEGVAHLPSPDSPPPGTSTEQPTESGRVGYLRDLWHAVRTQDVTMTDALLLFTQRSLDAKAAPPGMSTTPRSQLGPAVPPLTGPDAETPAGVVPEPALDVPGGASPELVGEAVPTVPAEAPADAAAPAAEAPLIP